MQIDDKANVLPLDNFKEYLNEVFKEDKENDINLSIDKVGEYYIFKAYRDNKTGTTKIEIPIHESMISPGPNTANVKYAIMVICRTMYRLADLRDIDADRFRKWIEPFMNKKTEKEISNIIFEGIRMMRTITDVIYILFSKYRTPQYASRIKALVSADMVSKTIVSQLEEIMKNSIDRILMDLDECDKVDSIAVTTVSSSLAGRYSYMVVFDFNSSIFNSVTYRGDVDFNLNDLNLIIAKIAIAIFKHCVVFENNKAITPEMESKLYKTISSVVQIDKSAVIKE